MLNANELAKILMDYLVEGIVPTDISELSKVLSDLGIGDAAPAVYKGGYVMEYYSGSVLMKRTHKIKESEMLELSEKYTSGNVPEKGLKGYFDHIVTEEVNQAMYEGFMTQRYLNQRRR